MNMTVKKGDNVVVIAGKDKGKTGKVLEVFPEEIKTKKAGSLKRALQSTHQTL